MVLILGDPQIFIRKIDTRSSTVGVVCGAFSVIPFRQVLLIFFNYDAFMAGEWNEENWFELADYAKLDMNACYEYKQSIISSDGNAASRDLSPDPGDYAADRADEGYFFPTILRPNEGSDSSEGKGPSDHNQDYTKTSTEHSEGSPSKCSSPSEVV